MGAATDLTGQRFGRLVVVCRAEPAQNYHKRYECLCDCGNSIVTRGTNLTAGYTKSCGCLNLDPSWKRSSSPTPETKQQRTDRIAIRLKENLKTISLAVPQETM